MLVSASDTDKKKKKKWSLNLLSCVIVYYYAKSLYFCKNIIFSWYVYSSLQVLWLPNK